MDLPYSKLKSFKSMWITIFFSHILAVHCLIYSRTKIYISLFNMYKAQPVLHWVCIHLTKASGGIFPVDCSWLKMNRARWKSQPVSCKQLEQTFRKYKWLYKNKEKSKVTVHWQYPLWHGSMEQNMAVIILSSIHTYT